MACVSPEGFSSGAIFEGSFQKGVAEGAGTWSYPEHEGRGGLVAEGHWVAGKLAAAPLGTEFAAPLDPMHQEETEGEMDPMHQEETEGEMIEDAQPGSERE
jgi:hypothetical protein